jgi:hypothetical protein
LIDFSSAAFSIVGLVTGLVQLSHSTAAIVQVPEAGLVGEEGVRQVDWDSPLLSKFSCFSTGSEVPKSPMMICERCEVGVRVLQVESLGGKASLPVAHLGGIEVHVLGYILDRPVQPRVV